jgi:hypothetical protein
VEAEAGDGGFTGTHRAFTQVLTDAGLLSVA